MNCKKYRACIIGVIVAVLVFGIYLGVSRSAKEIDNENCVLVWEPADGARGML